MNLSSPTVRSYPARASNVFVEIEHASSESLYYSISENRHLARYVFSATAKVIGGIQHLTALSRRKPTPRAMSAQCLKWGRFSERPYRLGQVLDDSISICVYALYEDYCRTRLFDPTSLLARAYRGWEQPRDWPAALWDDIRRLAQWQGTHFPSPWTDADARLLLHALREINRPFLAEVLEIEILEHRS